MMYLTEPMVAHLVMMIILGCCMLQYCMLRQATRTTSTVVLGM